MNRLTRGGTAEPVSRDQIPRRERGQGNFIFFVELTTSRIGNLTRLIHTLAIYVTIHSARLKGLDTFRFFFKLKSSCIGETFFIDSAV